jgi:hypothetical protein
MLKSLASISELIATLKSTPSMFLVQPFHNQIMCRSSISFYIDSLYYINVQQQIRPVITDDVGKKSASSMNWLDYTKFVLTDVLQ